MNILDIIILICLIPAIIQGFRKGFISNAISTLSIIAGIWASARFANMFGIWLSQYFDVSEQVLKVISFLGILTIVIVGLELLGKLLETVIKMMMLNWLNKVLGILFSIFKYMLIIGLILLALSTLNETFQIIKPEATADSILFGPLVNFADAAFPYIKNTLAIN